MPRQARVKSNTGIYHIMTRGINKEQIFNTNINKNSYRHNKRNDKRY